MKKSKLVKLMVIPMVLVGMVLPFAQPVSAEHIQVDKDDPAIEATNNMIIEKNPERLGYKVESSAVDEGRAVLYAKSETAEKGKIELLEGLKTKLHSQYQEGYGATAIQFTDLKDTDTVTVTYNRVGTYNGRPVSAKVELSGMQHKKVITNGVDYEEPTIDFSENLYSGMFFINIGKMIEKYTFFDESGKPIELKNDAYMTFNSLNSGEFVNYATGDATLNSYTTKDSLVKWKGNPIDNQDAWVGIGGAFLEPTDDPIPPDFFEDWIGSSTFKRATVSFQVSGTAQIFSVGAQRGLSWMAFNSATLFNVVPEPPTKEVEDESNQNIGGGIVKPGQEITYKISQKVNVLGTDLLEKYKSMTFVDKLPEEVTYVDSELQDEKGTVVDEKGTKEFDEASHTLTYKVSTDFLQKEDGMKYEGETYTLSVKVKVKDDVKDGEVLKNIANVTINENAQDTNEVTVTPEVPVVPTPEEPEPKPEAVTPQPKPEVPEEVIDLPATGGMDMNTKYTLGFVMLLAVVSTVSGVIIYVTKKRA